MGVGVLSGARQTPNPSCLVSKRVRAEGQSAGGQGVGYLRHPLDSSGAELRHRLQQREGRGGGGSEESSGFIPGDKKGVHGKSLQVLRGVPE